jgi:type III pantothenate kinase
MKKLLSIDIGNSTIGFGLFLNPAKSKNLFIKKIPTHPLRSPASYEKIISGFMKSHIRQPFDDIDTIISSVVPSINGNISTAIKNICGRKPFIVTHRSSSGLALDVKKPEEVGADRIANAVGGFHYFKKPVAIIDFGTATTITVVGKNGNLLGGAILPGLNIMRSALRDKTAKLPLIASGQSKKFLGNDTASSISSGIFLGTAGAVESLAAGMEKELNFKLNLILTGGHATLMSGMIKKPHTTASNLTFEGLRLIYLETVNKK